MITIITKHLTNPDSFKRRMVDMPNKLAIYFKFNDNKDLLVSRLLCNFRIRGNTNINSRDFFGSSHTLSLANTQSIKKVSMFKKRYPYDISDIDTIKRIKEKLETEIVSDITNLTSYIRLDPISQIDSVPYSHLIHSCLGNLINMQINNSFKIYNCRDRYFLVALGAIIEVKLDTINNCIYDFEPLLIIKFNENQREYLNKTLFIHYYLLGNWSRRNALYSAVWSDKFSVDLPGVVHFFNIVSKYLKINIELSNKLLDNKNKYFRKTINEILNLGKQDIQSIELIKDMKSKYFEQITLKSASNLKELHTLNLKEREEFAEYIEAKIEIQNTGKLVLE